MPRNKYPEETVKIILDAALKLFLEKGYEETTVLDIVNQMGGLTRGAFYHHFKSKEEVLLAINEKLFFDINPFDKVRNLVGLNGLQKIKWVLSAFYTNKEYSSIQVEAFPLFNSPTILKKAIDNHRDSLAPKFSVLIKEGINDGSIKAENPKLIAELFVLLANFWMIPTIYPYSTEEEARQKFDIVKNICVAIGLPVFDAELIAMIEKSGLLTKS